MLFLPAMAEEMNKSRHVVAQASRALAQSGVGVLSIDLSGCGDSSGRLADVQWTDWLADASLAADWMRAQGYARLWLWGMRLGSLVAAEFAHAHPDRVERCLFWQPVVNGESALVQFLRLRAANAIIAGKDKEGETVKQLRARLAAGETLEVAGYALAPSLARAVERAKLESLRPSCKVHWMEIVAEAGRRPGAASTKVIEAWQAHGTTVTTTLLAAEPFWASTNAVELVQCPSIVEATLADVGSWLR